MMWCHTLLVKAKIQIQFLIGQKWQRRLIWSTNQRKGSLWLRSFLRALLIGFFVFYGAAEEKYWIIRKRLISDALVPFVAL